MTKPILFLSLLLLAAPFTGNCKKNDGVIAAGAKPEKLAEGFAFTEGPVADKKGNVYFTDQPNDRILIWSVDGKLSTFLQGTGRANGTYFDRGGRHLLACSDMDNQIWSIDMDGNHTVLVADFNGQKLNGPNDLWVNPKTGGIYFTDPLYARDYWTRDPKTQTDGENVYYLSPDRKTLTIADGDLVKPNGIVGTPDGKHIYVADIQARKTYIYDILSDGSLANKRLFANSGSDGMTIDNRGNIYMTGRGVIVFNPEGEQIENIAIEDTGTTNVCFGGKDGKTLFITAVKYLYGVRMNVKGVR